MNSSYKNKWTITVKEAARTSAFHPGYMWYATGPGDEYLENIMGFMNHQSAVQDAMARIALAKVMWSEREDEAGIWKYDYE